MRFVWLPFTNVGDKKKNEPTAFTLLAINHDLREFDHISYAQSSHAILDGLSFPSGIIINEFQIATLKMLMLYMEIHMHACILRGLMKLPEYNLHKLEWRYYTVGCRNSWEMEMLCIRLNEQERGGGLSQNTFFDYF